MPKPLSSIFAAKAKLHSTIKKLKISGIEVNEISEITGETEE